ncbi:MAG: DeoR/GlpR family DNA-binding transcription regulator [Bacillota bacterium]|nr:DeoR/GlpR family DNA-binding transcription regulator [Bacillota bacterium]
MTLQAERQLIITSLIRANKTVSVDDLSKRFNVSFNTIRRDLDALERQGILRRTQGGAILVEFGQFAQPFHVRKAEYSEEKAAIGRVAARLVTENDIIIIDAGTTAQQVAKNLGHLQHVTILTNSLEVANDLLVHANITVIPCGGVLRPTSRSMVGIPAEQFFSQFHADKAFIGVGGISLETGLTNPNIHETAVKKKMIEAAKEVIVVADHHKFERVSLSPIAPITAVHKIVTDNKTPAVIIKNLENLGIEVIVA